MLNGDTYVRSYTSCQCLHYTTLYNSTHEFMMILCHYLMYHIYQYNVASLLAESLKCL